jgi:hypothetical protein
MWVFYEVLARDPSLKIPHGKIAEEQAAADAVNAQFEIEIDGMSFKGSDFKLLRKYLKGFLKGTPKSVTPVAPAAPKPSRPLHSSPAEEQAFCRTFEGGDSNDPTAFETYMEEIENLKEKV